MTAKYFVTVEPGVPVPGVGFVQPGCSFDAPQGFVPSTTLRAMNEEAALELDRVFAGAEVHLQGLLDRNRVTGSDWFAVERRLEELRKRRAIAKEVLTEDEAVALRATLPLMHGGIKTGEIVDGKA